MSMQASVDQFYGARFEKVIPLHIDHLTYQEAKALLATVPKGWIELSALPQDIRVEFSYRFWTKILPFHPKLFQSMGAFFSRLKDVGIYLLEDKKGGYRAEMVYMIENTSSFFRGGVPLSEEEVLDFSSHFNVRLPKDYLSFLQIHNGFSKSVDTGILPTNQVMTHFQKIKEEIRENLEGVIPPHSLIPFYESFGLHTYQCFFTEWHPMEGMGNIHYSSTDSSLSRYDDPETTLAFETFSDWMAFYLEEIAT